MSESKIKAFQKRAMLWEKSKKYVKELKNVKIRSKSIYKSNRKSKSRSDNMYRKGLNNIIEN